MLLSSVQLSVRRSGFEAEQVVSRSILELRNFMGCADLSSFNAQYLKLLATLFKY